MELIIGIIAIFLIAFVIVEVYNIGKCTGEADGYCKGLDDACEIWADAFERYTAKALLILKHKHENH